MMIRLSSADLFDRGGPMRAPCSCTVTRTER